MARRLDPEDDIKGGSEEGEKHRWKVETRNVKDIDRL